MPRGKSQDPSRKKKSFPGNKSTRVNSSQRSGSTKNLKNKQDGGSKDHHIKELLRKLQINESLLNSLGDGIIVQSLDYIVLFENEGLKNSIGDHVGEYCHKAYEGKDHICEDCPMVLSLNDGGTYKLEKRVSLDESVCYIELTTSPLRDLSGNIVAGIKIVRDVTDRKLAEENMRKDHDELELKVQERTKVLQKEIAVRGEMEKKLNWELEIIRAFAELSRILINPSYSIKDTANITLHYAKSLTSSTHGYVSVVDPETRENIGYTLTEMIGRSCFVFQEGRQFKFHAGKDGMYPGLWGYSLNTCKPFFTNSPTRHKAFNKLPKGHVQINNFLSVPSIFGNQLVGQIALANSERDFTKEDLDIVENLSALYANTIYRRHMGEALKKSEERFRRLADDSPIAISIINRNGDIEYINNEYVEILGYTIKDVPSLESWWSKAYPDEDKREDIIKDWNDIVNKIFSGGKIGIQKRRVVCKDRSVKDVEIRITPAADKIIVCFYDITERRRME